MKRETEVKIPIADPDQTARRLLELGADLVRPRALEDNLLLDFEDRRLARGGMLLRVRATAGRGFITVKTPDPGAPAGYKSRREIETGVEDPATLVEALWAVGLRTTWRYQKRRREYILGGAEVVIDELPFGTYLEIEGDPEAIDRVALLLGFTPSDYEIVSYRELHEWRCLAAGVPVGDLVFPDSPEAFG